MQKDDCVFCQIASGKIQTRVIHENDSHIAILSHAPNTEGFTVAFPKEHHHSYFAEVPKEIRTGLVEFSSEVAKLLNNVFEDVGRTGMMFEGFGVDHLHSKLFPMHGTVGEEWQQRASKVDKYFENYEGSISSHDYGEPNRPEIDETYKKILDYKK
ncbi:MAG: HIT family protein [Candidatus Dojkabacteria bacterium]